MEPLDSIPDWVWINNSTGFDESAVSHNNPHQLLGSSSSQSFLNAEIERQVQEIDLLLQMENQRLRLIMQEKSRQNAALFLKYEAKIMESIAQKDRDLGLVRNRTMELHSSMATAQENNEALRKKAMEAEAVVLDLSTSLEQAKAVGNLNKNNSAIFTEMGIGMGSFCESSSSASNRYECKEDEGENRTVKVKMGCCRSCKNVGLEVVFLPCHHLCCCRACEPLLLQCPVCQGFKRTSLEVLFD